MSRFVCNSLRGGQLRRWLSSASLCLLLATLAYGDGATLRGLIDQGAAKALRSYLQEHPSEAEIPFSSKDVRPLHYCAYHDRPECAATLLKAGADVHAVTTAGFTALHIAAARNAANTAPVLRKRKADLDAMDHKGNTPLHLAVMQDHPDMARMLILWGADHSLTNGAGLTPEAWAVEHARTGMVACAREAVEERWLAEYDRRSHSWWNENYRRRFDRDGDDNIDDELVDAYHQALYEDMVTDRDRTVVGLKARLDADADGQIDHGEAAEILQRFQDLRQLRRHDRAAYGRRRLAYLLQEFDVDGDGRLSRMEKALASEFSHASRNYGRLPSTQSVNLDIVIREPESMTKDQPDGGTEG